MLSNEKKRLVTLGVIGAAIAVAIALAGTSPKAAAGGRVPTDPAEVLETLATKSADPRTREADALRRTLALDPKNLRAALRLARLDIQLARERSDPRYLGQAQAALQPWWTESAPAPVLVLRATIEQSLHDFDAALRHLDLALTAAPDDTQAWLTRAVVLTVRARYDEARTSCARVASAPLAFAVCETQIDSLTGHAREAHDRLAPIVGQEGTSRDEQEWALSSLGEYAARFGDVPLAERHFREALAIAPEDAYVRAALADLLIDAARPAEAIEILRGRESDDGMLLRLAIAENAKDPEHMKMLTSRFDASRARGDAVHRREEARFALLLGERERALTLARANWDVQKEPWDVRVLVAAATNAAEAAPALEHLERTKLEDPAIRSLAARLR